MRMNCFGHIAQPAMSSVAAVVSTDTSILEAELALANDLVKLKQVEGGSSGDAQALPPDESSAEDMLKKAQPLIEKLEDALLKMQKEMKRGAWDFRWGRLREEEGKGGKRKAPLCFVGAQKDMKGELILEKSAKAYLNFLLHSDLAVKAMHEREDKSKELTSRLNALRSSATSWAALDDSIKGELAGLADEIKTLTESTKSNLQLAKAEIPAKKRRVLTKALLSIGSDLLGLLRAALPVLIVVGVVGLAAISPWLGLGVALLLAVVYGAVKAQLERDRGWDTVEKFVGSLEKHAQEQGGDMLQGYVMQTMVQTAFQAAESRAALSTVNGGVKDLRGDVTDLKGGINTLASNIDHVSCTMKQELGKVQDNMMDNMAGMQETLAALMQGIQLLTKAVTEQSKKLEMDVASMFKPDEFEFLTGLSERGGAMENAISRSRLRHSQSELRRSFSSDTLGIEHRVEVGGSSPRPLSGSVDVLSMTKL